MWDGDKNRCMEMTISMHLFYVSRKTVHFGDSNRFYAKGRAKICCISRIGLRSVLNHRKDLFVAGVGQGEGALQ